MKKLENVVLNEKSIEAKIPHVLSCVLGVMAVLLFCVSADPLAFSSKDWKTRDAFSTASFVCLFCSSTLWSLGTIVDNSKKQTILLKEYIQKR